MKLGIRKIEERGIIPEYQTKGSSGLDLHAIDTISIPAGTTKKVRTGLAFDIPEGYELQIRPRSGMSFKTKIRVANSPGTIDSDFKSEVVIILDNISQNQAEAYQVRQGDRVAQAVLQKVEKVEIVEVEEIEQTGRGSLGSTDV